MCTWGAPTSLIHICDTQLNRDVPVPGSGLITSQMVLQERRDQPAELSWNTSLATPPVLLSSGLNSSSRAKPRRSPQQELCAKGLLPANFCCVLLSAIEIWIQEVSGNGSDLAVNTRDTFVKSPLMTEASKTM